MILTTTTSLLLAPIVNCDWRVVTKPFVVGYNVIHDYLMVTVILWLCSHIIWAIWSLLVAIYELLLSVVPYNPLSVILQTLVAIVIITYY